MKNIMIAFGLMFLFFQHSQAQNFLNEIRRSSHQTFVYRISADTAEKYMNDQIGDVDHYAAKDPVFVFDSDSSFLDNLPSGNYLFISVKDTMLVKELYCSTNIQMMVTNNRVNPQVYFVDSDNNFVPEASVFFNKQQLYYNSLSYTYTIPKSKFEEAVIKFVSRTDTTFFSISEDDDYRLTAREQKRIRFLSTKFYRLYSSVLKPIKKIFKPNKRYYYRKSQQRTFGSGYMVFNKPKYFPADTVKFKAYVLKKNKKVYKKDLSAFLTYYDTKSRENVSVKLAMLHPKYPGSYSYSFYTGDTLAPDKKYELSFLTRRKKRLLKGSFRIEDYIIDEITSYNVKTNVNECFRGDSIILTLSAKDANGLNAMDVTANIALITKSINSYYGKQIFIPDTLWQSEKKLLTDQDTRIAIPSTGFPTADINISPVVVFKNSNNEQKENTSLTISFFHSNARLIISDKEDSVTASFYKKGRSIVCKGLMKTDVNDKVVVIEYPYKVKANPNVSTYYFSIDTTIQTKKWESHDIGNSYKISFSRVQSHDSAGFVLGNPYKIPVFYSVFFKGKNIFSATSDNANIVWIDKVPNNKIYNVRWQYQWSGRECFGEQSIVLLTKTTAVDINALSSVYPGQKDTIKVSIKDYRDMPVKKMNLTALAYNNQVSGGFKVPEPPYIQRFKEKSPILYSTYASDPFDGVLEKSTLSNHKPWIKKLGLDTMLYYQFLYPDSGYVVYKNLIKNVLPQLSVYAVKNGVPQEIYLLYVNNNLVYFNGITSYTKNSFSCFPGYTKIGMRLKDSYIEYDSVYLQPYYKHDIFFDINQTHLRRKIHPRSDYWEYDEKKQLNDKILTIENNARNNYAYLWQNDKLYSTTGYGYSDHILGPFLKGEKIQFYKPSDFDMDITFEPGYSYRITPKVVRLEKKVLFPLYEKIKLKSSNSVNWKLGDTLDDIPEIKYTKATPLFPDIMVNTPQFNGKAKISIELPADSVYEFTIIQNTSPVNDYFVWRNGTQFFMNVDTGCYKVMYVTPHNNILSTANFVIDSTGTYFFQFSKNDFRQDKTVLEEVYQFQDRKDKELSKQNDKAWHIDSTLYKEPEVALHYGTCTIKGIVSDAKSGQPIPNVTVKILGYKKATITNTAGSYNVINIPSGKYRIQFSQLGYETKNVEIEANNKQTSLCNVKLELSKELYQDVVVVAYGYFTQKKMDKTGSISSISYKSLNSLAEVLNGKVAGVSATVSPEISIAVRGASSISAANTPLYIIDGVAFDKIPADLNPADIETFDVLKDASSTAIYGARGANGVVIMKSKNPTTSTIRSKFKDYAFWKPDIITDDDGVAKFVVDYPDNVTSWTAYVIGMDRKKRIAKASKVVRSYKPVMAQLSMPQFLVEGDTTYVVGKKFNYTNKEQFVHVKFIENNQSILNESFALKENDAGINKLRVIAQPGKDSIRAVFSLQSSEGFSDGEQRQIPIVKQGTMEAKGNFMLLDKDTTISISIETNNNAVFTAQQSVLEVLMEELDHLKKYPYYCMEQTASKLTGLYQEKNIKHILGQKFEDENQIKKLLQKIQKGQQYNGGWGWWQGTEANVVITNYITRALIAMPKDEMLTPIIRDALLFLHNSIGPQNEPQYLETLYTLSEAGHDMDYSSYLSKIDVTKLSEHEKWQVVSIMWRQKMPYQNLLDELITKHKSTMLGGVYWGENVYRWYNNDIATTIVAYKTLMQIGGYEDWLQKIIVYFIEKKRNGYWRNTVETATIVSTVLSYFANHTSIASPQEISVSGDTSFVVKDFPFKTNLSNQIKNIAITKKGRGISFISTYYKQHNPKSEKVDSNFIVSTSFEKDGQIVQSLKAGEKYKMLVNIKCLKDAEYVLLEIPIPAGCIISKKPEHINNMYWEYYKDKVNSFAEKMNSGTVNLEIEVESRYTGNYTLNPAKIELMYFPLFMGRDEMKRIVIE